MAKKNKEEIVQAVTGNMAEMTVPSLKEILAEFTRLRRGPRGIARMLNRAYMASKPGSVIQNMILQMVLTAAKSVSAAESTKDTSGLSDEDIKREIDAILEDAAKEVPRGGR